MLFLLHRWVILDSVTLIQYILCLWRTFILEMHDINCFPICEAGGKPLPWLADQTSSFSGYRQFKYISLPDHLGSHRCPYRLFKGKPWVKHLTIYHMVAMLSLSLNNHHKRSSMKNQGIFFQYLYRFMQVHISSEPKTICSRHAFVLDKHVLSTSLVLWTAVTLILLTTC